jgi:dTDP-4-dehydrorhamnose reductase
MKILVLGGNGQLGQALQRELGECQMMGLDLPEIDITDVDGVRCQIAAKKPNCVINVAAYTDVDGAETQPELAYKVNALGAKNVALATNQLEIPVVYVSTDYVFDGTQEEPYHEWMVPNPLGVYGKSKLAGEEAVQKHNHRHFIVRTAWLFHSVGKNFLKTMCALSHHSEVRVVGDQFGSPTFAPHLAKGMFKLVKTKNYGLYHMAGRGKASWYQLTQVLYQCLGYSTKIIPIPRTEFPQIAPRPQSTVLTTLHGHDFLLPPWEKGVQDFVREYELSVGTVKEPASFDHKT